MDDIKIPEPLRPGDKAALIAPSSPPKSGQLKTASDSIEHLGLIPVIYPSCTYYTDTDSYNYIDNSKNNTKPELIIPHANSELHYVYNNPARDFTDYPYLAAPDCMRAADINAAFASEEIKAIFCLRGGYGSMRLASLIDYDTIARHPKAFVGSSDVSFLQSALLQNSSLLTFHAPMPASGYHQQDEITLNSLKRALFDKNYTSIVKCQSIKNGTVSGRILPFNLTLLFSLMGTLFEPDTADRVLFLEDVNEPLYKIDRMLTSLILAEKFRRCAGIVFGRFTGCCKTTADEEILHSMIREITRPADCPVLTGFPFGHEFPCITLPAGGLAHINGPEVKIAQSLIS